MTALVVSESPIRYTPAGIPILEVWLEHESEQIEAEQVRHVKCTIQAVLAAKLASKWSGKLLSNVVNVSGFLSQRSLRNPRLVLHIEHVEFVESE